jgi:hypothetical protein
LSSSPKTGGTANKIIAYLIFPGSVGKWQPPAEWFALANKIFQSWGGLPLLEKLLIDL